MTVDDNFISNVQSFENLNVARTDRFPCLNLANLGASFLDAKHHCLALLSDYRHAGNCRRTVFLALHAGKS